MKNLYNEVRRAIAWILFLLAFTVACSSGGEFRSGERDASVWQTSFDSGQPGDTTATGGTYSVSSSSSTPITEPGNATGGSPALLDVTGGYSNFSGGAAGSTTPGSSTAGATALSSATGGSTTEDTGGAAATGGDVATGGSIATGGAATGGAAATGGDVATGGSMATGGAATGGAGTGGATTDPGACPCPTRACKAYQSGCNLPGSKASDWPNEVGLQCVTSQLQCPTAARPVYCFIC